MRIEIEAVEMIVAHLEDGNLEAAKRVAHTAALTNDRAYLTFLVRAECERRLAEDPDALEAAARLARRAARLCVGDGPALEAIRQDEAGNVDVRYAGQWQRLPRPRLAVTDADLPY